MAKVFSRAGGFLKFKEDSFVKYYNLNEIEITVRDNKVNFPDGNGYLFSNVSPSFASNEIFADQIGTWQAEAQAGASGGEDVNAVHVNQANEIAGVTSKGTPTVNDFLLIEDVADGNSKKKITIGDIPATSDVNAVHVNVANEITAIIEKTTVSNQDEFIIEDSSSSFVKKSIKRKTLINPINNNTETATTLTPNIDEYEQESVNDLATALTIGAPTGTVASGMKLILRIADNGTARALTFNAIFRAIGVTLPTTTTANKVLYIGCIYNSQGSKWDVIAIKEEV